MAAYASAGKGNHKASASRGSAKSNEESPSQSREIITPSIVELTKEVRTNILCTVESCGKILPNTPALNMHLVKSHRVKVMVEASPLVMLVYLWLTNTTLGVGGKRQVMCMYLINANTTL